ncbi:2'-5' RNA ligase family protein [Ornithinimicrobium sp.]|uniref:2'-5' RNA ligase family protein n=1 Tax=Ornithinimicrobium sp. TaxID=1977084 RepID=UPI0034CFDC97
MTFAAPSRATPVVGVAIPVPEPWGSFLHKTRMGYGEERARNIPTHITLLPPTPVEPEQVCPLRRHLASVAAGHSAFTVQLRGTGTFRPLSDVVFIQLAQGVSSCERLEQAIRNGPVHRDLLFPYHPHVTLLHDEPAAMLDGAFSDLAAFTCRFPATSFRLYLHGGDGVWQVVEEFVLQA